MPFTAPAPLKLCFTERVTLKSGGKDASINAYFYLQNIRYLRIYKLLNVVFIETLAFTSCRRRYLSEDEYLRFQQLLIQRPESGALIVGTGGLRKIHWQDVRRGKGKRGGLRVIYYWWQPDTEIWLLKIYDKDEREDISAAEKRVLRELVRGFKEK